MEYCGIEPKGEDLYHYGVKGMHWGIRRYQPYSNGKSGKYIGEKKHQKQMSKQFLTSYKQGFKTARKDEPDPVEKYRLKKIKKVSKRDVKDMNKNLIKAGEARDKGLHKKEQYYIEQANKAGERAVNNAKNIMNAHYGDMDVERAIEKGAKIGALVGGPVGAIWGATISSVKTGNKYKYDKDFRQNTSNAPIVETRKQSFKVNKGRSSNKTSERVNDYLDSRNIPDHAKDEIRRAGVRYLDAYNKAQDHATKADFAPANKVKTHYSNYNVAMKKADDYYRDYKKVQKKWDFDVDDDDDLDVLESFRDKIKKK